MALATFVEAARSALADSSLAIPTLDAASDVTIAPVASQSFAHFVNATTPDKFSFVGPTPLAESVSDRAGAVSLVTADGRRAYQSIAALPPWGAGFTLRTTDATGRFIVETSFTGNEGAGNWRLAYRSDAQPWHYLTIAGVQHPADGTKNFDLVTLGAPGTYSVRLEFQWNATFFGIGFVDDASALSPLTSKAPLKVMIIGDSWTWPVVTDPGPSTQWDGYPLALLWRTGWNVLAAGVRGQGYLKVSAGEQYRGRVIRDVAPQEPDVVLFTGSPNDHCPTCTWTDQEIAAEAGAAIQALKRVYPRALVILCSPFMGWPQQNVEMQSVAKTLGVPYIDFITSQLITPANNVGNRLVDGHPTRAGGPYIAEQLLQAIAALR